MTTTLDSSEHTLNRRLWWWLGFLLVCRLILLIWAPHTDPTEARYAEMARKMVETGNWVTPQFDYGIPFWGNPPLSMWVSALGIDLFGANQFGSRIMIFLFAIGILIMIAREGSRGQSRLTGLAAAALLMSMPLFFYCSGAVMTDLIFVAGTTLAMVGFREAVLEKSKSWGYGFFIGIAIGVLAKGLLIFAIVVPPLIVWRILSRDGRHAWKRLPWLSGILLLLTIVSPWFWLAENRTPGFLRYFFEGEHLSRLLHHHWTGDLYGNSHSVLPGTIFVYLLAGMFPVSLGFFLIPIRRWRELGKWSLAHDGAGLYWLLWTVWPIALFIPFRNILASSPLPALPGAALLLASLAVPAYQRNPRSFHVLHPAIVSINIMIAIWALGVSLFWPDWAPKSSEKSLIRRYQHDRRPGDNLLYFGVRKSSAEFYAEGNIDHTGSVSEVEAKLNAKGTLYLAVPARYLPMLPEMLQRRFTPVASWGSETLYVESYPSRAH